MMVQSGGWGILLGSWILLLLLGERLLLLLLAVGGPGGGGRALKTGLGLDVGALVEGLRWCWGPRVLAWGGPRGSWGRGGRREEG